MDKFFNLFLYMTLLNSVFYSLSSLAIIVFKQPISSLHAKWFNLPKEALPPVYFNYLANYKLFILSCNLAPLLALWLMKISSRLAT